MPLKSIIGKLQCFDQLIGHEPLGCGSKFCNCLIFAAACIDSCDSFAVETASLANLYPSTISQGGRKLTQKGYYSLTAPIYCASVDKAIATHPKDSISYCIILQSVTQPLRLCKGFLYRQAWYLTNIYNGRPPICLGCVKRLRCALVQYK